MSWVSEDFKRVADIWAEDQAALDQKIAPFWDKLRAQLNADVDEFNKLTQSGDMADIVRLISSQPNRVQFGYKDGASVEVSIVLEDRSLYVIYIASKYGVDQHVPITSAQADFPGLSRSILTPILFPRLLHERGRATSR